MTIENFHDAEATIKFIIAKIGCHTGKSVLSEHFPVIEFSFAAKQAFSSRVASGNIRTSYRRQFTITADFCNSKKNQT